MAIINTELNYPEFIFINAGEDIADFMLQFKITYRYDSYDCQYLKRVLCTLSPAFVLQPQFDSTLRYVVGNFSDTPLIYSDETYDPSRTIKLASHLANKIFETLVLNGAYVNKVFPYDIYDITPALAVVFKFNKFHYDNYIVH